MADPPSGDGDGAARVFHNVNSLEKKGVADSASEEALFAFERDRMQSKVYRNEGDTTLYSKINLQKRTAIRENEQVQGWLSTFFSTFNHADLNGDGHADEIHREDVLEFELLVCRALFDAEDWNMEQAKQAVMDDLQREIGDATNMDAREFFHSLFETVDVWTETVEVDEYVAFLRRIYLRITYMDPSFAGRRFKKVKDVIAFSEVDTTYDSENESDMLDDSHVHDVSPKAGGDGHELPTHNFELRASQDGPPGDAEGESAEGESANNRRKRSKMLTMLLRTKSPKASLLGPSVAEADTDALDMDVPAHSAADEDVSRRGDDTSDMTEATHGVDPSTQASHDHAGKAAGQDGRNSKLNAKRLPNNKANSAPERGIIEGETRGDSAAKQEKSYFLAGGGADGSNGYGGGPRDGFSDGKQETQKSYFLAGGGNKDDSNGRGVYGGPRDTYSEGDPLGQRRGVGSVMRGGGGAKDTPVYLGGGDANAPSAPARASVSKPSRPQQQQQQQQQQRQHSQPRRQSELQSGAGRGTMASTGANANGGADGDAATAASAAEASAAKADTLVTSEERSATKPARSFVVRVSLTLFLSSTPHPVLPARCPSHLARRDPLPAACHHIPRAIATRRKSACCASMRAPGARTARHLPTEL